MNVPPILSSSAQDASGIVIKLQSGAWLTSKTDSNIFPINWELIELQQTSELRDTVGVQKQVRMKESKDNAQWKITRGSFRTSSRAGPHSGELAPGCPSPHLLSSHVNSVTFPRLTLAWGFPGPLAAAVAAAGAGAGTASWRRPCSEAPCLAAWACSHHHRKDQAADPPSTPWGPPLC